MDKLLVKLLVAGVIASLVGLSWTAFSGPSEPTQANPAARPYSTDVLERRIAHLELCASPHRPIRGC